VRYADIGFGAVPRVRVNGVALAAPAQPKQAQGWRVAEFDAPLRAGANRIVLDGPSRPLDYDYIEIETVAL